MSANLIVEGSAVLACVIAILALGSSPKQRNYRIGLLWIGLTVVIGATADRSALQHDDVGALFFIVLAASALILGAVFTFRAVRASIAEIRKRL
jgi:FtsH-binding integral membrane protein